MFQVVVQYCCTRFQMRNRIVSTVYIYFGTAYDLEANYRDLGANLPH